MPNNSVKNPKSADAPSLATTDATASEILKRMRETLAPISISIMNLSHQHEGHAESKKHGGGHYKLTITSDAFAGLNSRERQQWVMTVLKDLFDGPLHALQLDLKDPSETQLREEPKGSFMQATKRSSTKPRS